ncbi:MAG: hypothetical protein HQK51_21945 [Oligoflexia bacterium]|nr:hypothetical protein [Oligoflexia bacterium]
MKIDLSFINLKKYSKKHSQIVTSLILTGIIVLFFSFTLLALDKQSAFASDENKSASVISSSCSAAKITTLKQLEEEVSGLNFCELVDRSKIKRDYRREKRMNLPEIDISQDILAGKEVELQIEDIHYMQAGCSNRTKDGVYTVVQNAKDIKYGKLDIKAIPKIRVWKDIYGNIWTLDHRRVASFVLSGAVQKVPAIWVSSNVVIHDKFKFSNSDNGDKMIVSVDKMGAVVARKNKIK